MKQLFYATEFQDGLLVCSNNWNINVTSHIGKFSVSVISQDRSCSCWLPGAVIHTLAKGEGKGLFGFHFQVTGQH